MIRTIEIYDEKDHAVATRKVRNCTNDAHDDGLKALKKLQKYCRSINDNEQYYTWDWAPQYDA